MPVCGCFPCCSKKSDAPKSSKKPKEKVRKPKDLGKFVKECLKAHNELRKKHNCPPLKLNSKLSSHAQKYAEHLAATNTFQHSKDKFKDKNVGENLAAKSSGGHDVDYNGSEVTDYWYREISRYNFANESGTQGAGHFTQVVWKGSKKIGVGKAFSASGKVYVVTNYLPAGNVIGRMKENVLPPKATRQGKNR